MLYSKDNINYGIYSKTVISCAKTLGYYLFSMSLAPKFLRFSFSQSRRPSTAEDLLYIGKWVTITTPSSNMLNCTGKGKKLLGKLM